MVLQKEDGSVYDGIAIGKGETQLWEPVSEGGARTEQPEGIKESEPEWVHLAVVYSADNKVTAYRNGRAYGQPYAKGLRVTYLKHSSLISFGPDPESPLSKDKRFLG